MRRIYVDLDDVLAQTGQMLLRVLEEDFGRSVAFEDIHSYHLGISLQLDPSELDEFMRRTHEPDQLSSIEPMPGAAETLAAWVESSYEVFVVTGRPPATREATLAWLEVHSIRYTEFHFLDKLSDYYNRSHDPTDGTLSITDLPDLDLDLAIEDFPGITTHLTEVLDIPVALFDRPWNREMGEANGTASAPIVRCRSWTEIRERFGVVTESD